MRHIYLAFFATFFAFLAAGFLATVFLAGDAFFDFTDFFGFEADFFFAGAPCALGFLGAGFLADFEGNFFLGADFFSTDGSLNEPDAPVPLVCIMFPETTLRFRVILTTDSTLPPTL